MGKGPPLKNTNAKRGALMRKLIEEVLEEATENDDKSEGAPKTTKKKRKLVRKLVDMALAGDMQAINTVLDRVDGKPAQAVIVDGDGEGGVIQQALTVTFVRPPKVDGVS